ncbi:MAG: hypothetical protein IJU21_06085 [Bacteroidales bacterium]|nr:hypothetical protein [Bacteroidales bacterium]
MDTSRIYRVADLPFRVSSAGDYFLPDNLVNMKPFVSALKQGEEPLFTLDLIHGPLPKPQGTVLYKTDDGPLFPEISLYRNPDGSIASRTSPLPGQPEAMELTMSPDFKKARLILPGREDSFAFNNALMLLFTFASAPMGALEMHASVVVNGGKGYLFLGKSGTGKSTHSSLWLKHIPDTWLLNDDNPVLRLMPGGEVRVFGSPWSGKTPCYKSLSAPAGAVVRLSQAPHNAIERLTGVKAYASLMASASSFRPFSELANHWHNTLEAMVGVVPCYHLECLPDRDAALLCYNTVNG